MLNKTKEKYGYITTTPKLQWKDTNLLEILAGKDTNGHDVNWFNTDVNAPAMAEFAYHNNNVDEKKANEEEKIESCAYITVGTGIGVGLVINNKPVQFAPSGSRTYFQHPDKWQFPLPTSTLNSTDDENIVYDHFEGTCPFHGSACVERYGEFSCLGLNRANCGLRVETTRRRYHLGKSARTTGGLCAMLLLVASHEKIVLSGGVMRRTVCSRKFVKRSPLTSRRLYRRRQRITKEVWKS